MPVLRVALFMCAVLSTSSAWSFKDLRIDRWTCTEWVDGEYRLYCGGLCHFVNWKCWRHHHQTDPRPTQTITATTTPSPPESGHECYVKCSDEHLLGLASSGSKRGWCDNLSPKIFRGNFLFIYNVVKILLDGGAIPSKLTNYLIVHCLFSPVAIHTFAEEELRLETSSKE